MGALLTCFSDAREANPAPKSNRRSHKSDRPPVSAAAAMEALGLASSGQRSKGWAGSKDVLTDEQALAAAALLMQRNVAGADDVSIPFDRSRSVRQPGGQKKLNGLPRSSSTRPPTLADPIVQPQQLLNKDLNIDNLETNHFVLVHGGGFGAWCWYKTIALLEGSRFKVSAIDLSGSGINSSDTNSIRSVSEYAKPLTSFLEALGDGEKMILVGHDFGGACISYAMEIFPSKIAKAVFLCAVMPTDGQNILDVFSKEAGANDLMQQAQTFVYDNGKDHSPTAIDLDTSLLKDILFNQSPTKDVALALVSLRSIPFAPVLEKLMLTDKNYGSIRRYYIQTTEDNAIPLLLQESMCTTNPPEKIFKVKGSDHSPFFSKPQALHKILVEISRLPLLQVG